MAKFYSAKDSPGGKYAIQVTKAKWFKTQTAEEMACFVPHNNVIDCRKLLLKVIKYFEKKGSTHGVIAALVMDQKTLI